MSRCGYCGAEIQGDDALCPYHHSGLGENWAEGNRLMCDFFHRGLIPARLAEDLRREDDCWIFVEAASA
ncbi:MAG: hypothetical protein HY294_09900 [Candidatus Rokubacteria bacterium]|nr:hypothetical protein [Candidatus Rokubacteria bacterium]MBI3826297.1 hypothetical protein [Candidatus Rokubacteria bacterium]